MSSYTQDSQLSKESSYPGFQGVPIVGGTDMERKLQQRKATGTMMRGTWPQWGGGVARPCPFPVALRPGWNSCTWFHELFLQPFSKGLFNLTSFELDSVSCDSVIPD